MKGRRHALFVASATVPRDRALVPKDNSRQGNSPDNETKGAAEIRTVDPLFVLAKMPAEKIEEGKTKMSLFRKHASTTDDVAAFLWPQGAESTLAIQFRLLRTNIFPLFGNTLQTVISQQLVSQKATFQNSPEILQCGAFACIVLDIRTSFSFHQSVSTRIHHNYI